MNTLTLALTVAAISFHSSFAQDQDYRDTFNVARSDWSITGKNDFFPLQPGYRLEFKGGKTDLRFTVLDQTKVIDGVTCRVIEEYQTESGKLVEISMNFFAYNKKTNDVYYFGEDVDNYKDGKIVNHDSAWRSGVDGARYGLFMPAKPRVGDRFYQEIAPNAKDRIQIESITETVTTKLGQYKNCVKFAETTPLEPGVTDYKRYAPGVGMVQDGELKLVKIHKP